MCRERQEIKSAFLIQAGLDFNWLFRVRILICLCDRNLSLTRGAKSLMVVEKACLQVLIVPSHISLLFRQTHLLELSKHTKKLMSEMLSHEALFNFFPD